MERKETFDAGNFTEKQALATEIVNLIRSLDPPGRFLKRADALKRKIPPHGLTAEWEELSDAKAIHKACQVMRDISKCLLRKHAVFIGTVCRLFFVSKLTEVCNMIFLALQIGLIDGRGMLNGK